VTKQQGLMGLQEHDSITAGEKFRGKKRKKIHLPALVGQNGLDR